MNVIEMYMAELEGEAASTRRILESVPEAKYDWRPNEKAMSMAELCGHIASVPGGMAQVLGGQSFDISQITGPDAVPANRAELLATHDAAVRGAQEWLSGLGDAANETWKFTRGDEVLMELPRVAAIRSFMFNHLYHHRGQLSTYLRVAGERVPSIYGPTADENPVGD